MPPPALPPIVSNPDALEEPMRSRFAALWTAVIDNHLPMRLQETRRVLARQRWMFKKGYSAAMEAESPHVWGLAVDVVLNDKSREWRGIGERPMTVDGSGCPWDTGYQRAADGDVVLKRRCVAHVVRAFGELVLEHGLVWGGTNAGQWRNPAPSAEFGRDPFHVELPGWRSMCPRLPPPL